MPVFLLFLLALQRGGGGAAPVPEGVEVERAIVYGKTGGKDLLLDLYRPVDRKAPLPVVVWIHGGAFRGGSRTSREGTGAIQLAAKGYAVASVDYRLSGEAIFPAQLEDCKAAVRFLRANATRYGLRNDRIAAWGASAGGNLAALLGTAGSGGDAVQAVVDFFGPTDFLKMDAVALPGGQRHDAADSPESQLIGGPIQENMEKAARANPIAYVTKRAPPFLIVHGDRDLLVPFNQSELLYNALRKAGVEATFCPLAGAGHGGPQFESPEIRATVLEFFDRHLKR
jgi:acetyl esterase/lipase